MGLNKKHSNISKIVILTLLICVAVSIYNAIESKVYATGTVGAGVSCSFDSKMELNVRSNSIVGTNKANPAFSPFYCMWHGRALTYFNKPKGGGAVSSAASSISTITGTQDGQTSVGESSPLSVSSTINNFKSMIQQLPDNPYANEMVGDTALADEELEPTVIEVSDEESVEDQDVTKWKYVPTALTWSEYASIFMSCKMEIEPSCGYAIYYLINECGINPANQFSIDFQFVIWASRLFTGSWGGFQSDKRSMLYEGSATAYAAASMKSAVRARAYQFGTCYYEIFSKDKEARDTMFYVTPDAPDTQDDTLKVMVDKTTGTYTVGPYKLHCRYGGEEAKQILYNEITGEGNYGYKESTRFAKYLEITNLNYEGRDIKDVEYLKADGTKFKDDSVDGITNFPNFVTEEDFYIRFVPSEEGAINRLSESETELTPIIRVEYISQIDVDGKAVYESTQLQAHEVHAIFEGGQKLAESIKNWLIVRADLSVPPECEYKIDEVSWTPVTGYTVKQHIGSSSQRVDGTTDITVKITFATKGGKDPHTVEVKFESVPVYQIIYGSWGCHCAIGCCGDYHDFPDPPPADKWLFVGSDIEADDIIVDGVLVQPLGRLECGSEYYKYIEDWWSAELSYGHGYLNRTKVEGHIKGNIHTNITETKVGGKRINMQLGGYVWVDAGDAKTGNFNNLRETKSQENYNNGGGEDYFYAYSYKGFWNTPKDNDLNFGGVLIELYDMGPTRGAQNNPLLKVLPADSTKPIAYTTTDNYGRYRFYGLEELPNAKDSSATNLRSILNPLHDYFIKFKFNGQMYTQVESNIDGKFARWTNGGEGQNSSADEITGEGGEAAEDTVFTRKALNERFENIKSLYNGSESQEPAEDKDNASYEGMKGQNKAFAVYQKIEKEYGKFSDQKIIEGHGYRDDNDNKPKYVHGWQDHENDWAYAYGDAWDDFIKKATNKINGENGFTNPEYMDCTKVWFEGDYNKSSDVYDWVLSQPDLIDKWGENDKEYVIKFINDCLMKAKTISPTYTIPEDYDKFVINNVNEKLVEVAPEYDPELASTYWNGFKNLYTQKSDQSRYVNYGVHERKRADLAIQKDVFNAKVIVDGELETYDYRSKNMEQQATDEAYDPAKDTTTWNIYTRRADILYKLHNEQATEGQPGQDAVQKDGETAFVHPLEIRRSDYLKTWEEDIDKEKNLKILITYRIAVKNQGSVPVVINDLADYYDSDEMEFDGILNGDEYEPIKYKTYSNDGDGASTNGEGKVNSYTSNSSNANPNDDTEKGKLTVKTKGYDGRESRKLIGEQIDSGLSNEYKYYYDTIFLSGINGGQALEPGKITFAYVSFRVKNPEVTRLKYSKIKDKPILDIEFDSEEDRVGKRNIVEINSYSTHKTDDNINYGIIDIDSCAGSTDNNDLVPETGNLKINNDPLQDHQEDDTDEAPNLRIRTSSADDTRVYTGYAYEDDRNTVEDKAVVGDALHTGSETKINGVTMQIWMLQREVDDQGIFTGKYQDSAKRLQQYRFTVQDESREGLKEEVTDPRYATGKGENRILFDAESIPALKVNLSGPKIPTLSEGDGQYAYVSIPAGDYFIRFIYGDTYETTLTNNSTDKEQADVRALLSPMTYEQNQDEVLKTSVTATQTSEGIDVKGLNLRSYNGQDYKSTGYQKDIQQEGSYYNGIYGYGYGAGGLIESYDTQNYSISEDGYNKVETETTYRDYVRLKEGDNGYDKGNNRQMMYYYDIAKSEGTEGASDAKDVYYYRWRANNYGRGTVFEGNPEKTQRNTLMETLNSWERLQTYLEGNKAERQNEMVKELMEQTKIVAQTGIISTKGEYNTIRKDNQGAESGVNNIESDNTHQLTYVIEHLNLGISERPEAQLKLTKKITNFQVTLANGRVLFDASKSVRNLYMAEHKGHMTFFANNDNLSSGADSKYTYWSSMTENKEPVDPARPDGVTKGQEALRKEKENLYKGSASELRRLAAVVTSANSKETPELLQVYMDDELMEGAMMRVRYDFLIENAGEVDYLDKQFYYTLKSAYPDNPDNVSRTNAYTVVDYVTNMIRYDQQYQDTKNGNPIVWTAKNLHDLMNSSEVDRNGNVTIGDERGGSIDDDGNVTAPGLDTSTYRRDLVNRNYANIVKTYNQILTTDSLRDNQMKDSLLPVKYFTYNNRDTAIEENKTVHTTTLILSTELSTNNTGDNLVYNNLAELVETQNTLGRRMQYSIIGNQSMSDQSLRNDATILEDSSEDLVTPKEIDADSAQKIVITKPTGEYRNYTPWIITAIVAFAIIAISAVVISVKVLSNKNK